MKVTVPRKKHAKGIGDSCLSTTGKTADARSSLPGLRILRMDDGKHCNLKWPRIGSVLMVRFGWDADRVSLTTGGSTARPQQAGTSHSKGITVISLRFSAIPRLYY